MDFLKRRNDYIVMYSKQEAIKLLRADERVRQIRITAKKMYIYTHPIIPFVTKERYKGSFLCPIGTYKITITEMNKYIYVRIKREKWERRMHHYHIQDNWGGDHICWGNANTEVNIIEPSGNVILTSKVSANLKVLVSRFRSLHSAVNGFSRLRYSMVPVYYVAIVGLVVASLLYCLPAAS